MIIIFPSNSNVRFRSFCSFYFRFSFYFYSLTVDFIPAFSLLFLLFFLLHWLKCNFSMFTKCKWIDIECCFYKQPQIRFVLICMLEKNPGTLLLLFLMKIFSFRLVGIFRYFCFFFVWKNLFKRINFAFQETAKLKYKTAVVPSVNG